MADEKELQEKALVYKILESRLESFAKQRDLLVQRMIELESTIESIKELGKTKDEVLFPLGSSAYTFGKTTSGKMIVEVGAGVALEETPEEAMKILEDRKKEVEDVLKNIQNQMIDVVNKLDILSQELQSLAEEHDHEHLEGG